MIMFTKGYPNEKWSLPPVGSSRASSPGSGNLWDMVGDSPMDQLCIYAVIITIIMMIIYIYILSRIYIYNCG